MKKKFVIILIAQAVLIMLFLVYGYLQKLEADKQVELRMQERDKMISLQKLSEDIRIENEREIEKLKEELKNCH